METHYRQEMQIEDENDAKIIAGPSHAETFQVLQTAFKWFEKKTVSEFTAAKTSSSYSCKEEKTIFTSNVNYKIF